MSAVIVLVFFCYKRFMAKSTPYSPHVLVFDSGVGALSIIREISQQLPQCSLTYASDNAFFPYGTRTEDELVDRVHRVLDACIAACTPDIIVVACNTASTVALPRVRRHFTQDIVGVVPAIKPAALNSRSNVIGLLATPATVERSYTHQLIREFAVNCRIIPIGTGELVHWAEKKLRGEAVNKADIGDIIAPLFEPTEAGLADTIVLACTHFPLLKQELMDCSPRTVDWIDSGDAIARRVAFLIDQLPSESLREGGSGYRSIFTARNADIESLRPFLQQMLPGPVEYVTVK